MAQLNGASIELPPALAPLMAERRWVVWRFERNHNGELTKVPYRATSPAYRASSKKPSSWSSYQAARAALARGGVDGVGYVLTGGEISALDLDDCRDPETGALTDWAAQLVERSCSYVEVTPSGAGLRIIGTAAEDAEHVHEDLPPPMMGSIYRKSERYITVTGRWMPGCPDILANIDRIVDELRRQPDSPPAPKANGNLVGLLPRSLAPNEAPRDEMPAELERLIADGTAVGDRSDQFHHVIGWLKDLGFKPAAIEAELRRHPDGIASKYLRPRDRLTREVERCFRKTEDKPQLRSTLRHLDDGSLYDVTTGEVVQPFVPEPSAPAVDFADLILRTTGLVAEIARWILSVARRPQPRLAVAAALSIIGTVASRQMKSPTFSPLNTYFLITARSGNGKDAAIRAVKAVLTAADLVPMIGPEGASSDVGLYDQINRAPVSVMPIDEFGDFIAATTGSRAPPHTLKIMAAMRSVWDGGMIRTSHAVTRHSVTLYDPCLSLFCASTPAQFFDAVGHAQVLNGFLNRFMLIHAGEDAERNPVERDIADVPREIADAVRTIANRPGGLNCSRFWIGPGQTPVGEPAYRVPWTDDARTAWYAYEDENLDRMRGSERLEAFAPRVPQNAVKVATILAVADDLENPLVTERHIELGRIVAEASLADMRRGYDEHSPVSASAALAEKVLARIRDRGVVTKRDLFRALQKSFGRVSELDEILKGLVLAGEIGVEEVATGARGPKTPTYRALQ